MDNKLRCHWVGDDPQMIAYHDDEWGKPLYDEQRLFELLSLEGMQAGLSWKTVLKKREAFREAFYGFNITQVAKMKQRDIERLMQNAAIIRNRLKIAAVIHNARCWQALAQKASVVQAIWQHVDGKPMIHHCQNSSDVPVSTPESKKLSLWLGQHGFKFTGDVICYAFMQASGMVNDHITDCYLYH